jgi:hypothetical protein
MAKAHKAGREANQPAEAHLRGARVPRRVRRAAAQAEVVGQAWQAVPGAARVVRADARVAALAEPRVGLLARAVHPEARAEWVAVR